MSETVTKHVIALNPKPNLKTKHNNVGLIAGHDILHPSKEDTYMGKIIKPTYLSLPKFTQHTRFSTTLTLRPVHFNRYTKISHFIPFRHTRSSLPSSGSIYTTFKQSNLTWITVDFHILERRNVKSNLHRESSNDKILAF